MAMHGRVFERRTAAKGSCKAHGHLTATHLGSRHGRCVTQQLHGAGVVARNDVIVEGLTRVVLLGVGAQLWLGCGGTKVAMDCT